MSLIEKLRKDAARETDPERRRQRMAKLDALETEVRDLNKRFAAMNARLAESAKGSQPKFLSWIGFVYGLAAAAALIGSFYFELPPVVWIVVLCAVVSAMAGIHLLIIRSRLKRLERSA